MTTTPEARPTTDVDLFGSELADDPYETYRALRDAGPALYVPEHDFWLISRYADVRAAALDYETYSSAQGVALLDDFNAAMRGSVLASDPPQHGRLRAVLAEQLSPRGVRAMREHIATAIDAIVAGALEHGELDGVTDLAQRIPTTIVGDLIGVPIEGRENLLPGADAVFTSFGPFTPLLQERLPRFMAYLDWMTSVTNRETLAPGSWGAAVLDAVDEGKIAEESAVPLLNAFLVAGMDTTSNGLAAMLRVFAEQPHVWAALREDPSRAGAVFEETLRLESPVQGFFRVTTREVAVDGTVIPAGARVLLHFGAANRDERHYPDPDTFDVTRNPVDHLAFGYGNHGCGGQAVARLEATSLVDSLLARVESFALAGDPVRHHNPVVRGLAHLPVSVVLREG